MSSTRPRSAGSTEEQLSIVDALIVDDPDGQDTDEAPEPLASLCRVAGRLQLWQVPSAGRRLGLTIGQADREFPYELLAAVADSSTLPM